MQKEGGERKQKRGRVGSISQPTRRQKWAPMPWSQLTESEAKIISRVVENIKQQDFATKSIRHWAIHFADVFDKFFISSRIGRIALVYNSCSTSLKQRLLALDVGDEAKKDSYTYLNLLQMITTVVHSPNARDDATMQIYKGFRQTSSESVQTFLQRVRDVAEEAYGPSSSWSMSMQRMSCGHVWSVQSQGSC